MKLKSVNISGRSRLKGFTLIELIIVIAIIGILAAITSIAIGGFQRDARMETDNDRAKLIYTGFQDTVTQCEIKQDVTPLGAVKGNKYLTVEFTVDDNQSDPITAISLTVDGAAKTLTADETAALKKAVTDQMSLTFDGKCYVYIDLDNYVVDSVCYFEDAAKGATYIANATYFDTKKLSGSQNCTMLKSMDDQKKLIKTEGVYAGGYPLSSALTT